MRISGIASFKNIITLGYPAIEAVLSVLPMVDEYLINDGGSNDDTWHWLERLKIAFPEKIRLFAIPWGGQNCCKEFDASLNNLIWEATGDWIIEGQGDEFVHERDLASLRNLIENLHNEGYYNSIRWWCKSCSWTKVDQYRYYNVRIVRKKGDLISSEWGDCFYHLGHKSVREGFTSHNFFPEWFEGDKLCYYHMHRLFPQNRLAADFAMMYQNAGGDPPRVDVYEASKKIDWGQSKPPKPEEILDCIPAIIRGLSQSPIYYVRPELFDKGWLKKTTGINYA